MPSPHRTHNHDYFFKYMPASTAEIVLSNSTLRWSSPYEFNDPFDVPRDLAFGVTPTEIQTALINKLEMLIATPLPPDQLQNYSPLVQQIVTLFSLTPSLELKKSIFQQLRVETEGSSPSEMALIELRKFWKAILPNMRILSLCEHNDIASMWHHYAEKYTGVAMKIRCEDDLDSAWLMAKKVEYPIEKPYIYTAEGWAELLIQSHQKAIETIIHTSTNTKSPDWSYENEWRISTSKRANDHGLVSDYPVAAQELGDMYLGPLIETEQKNKLIALAHNFPNMKIFETKIGFNREFEFTEVEV